MPRTAVRRLRAGPADTPRGAGLSCTGGYSPSGTRSAVVGLRKPYWGPVSGHSATVGGALSQGSIYYGSASQAPSP